MKENTTIDHYDSFRQLTRKESNMIFLHLFSLGFCLNLEKINSGWNFNPNCPTEDAARDCEDDCITINAKCILDCNGNQECIRQCSRDHATCIDVCPCYSGCYNGCPCLFESEYCKSCEARYEKDRQVCNDLEKQKLDSCIHNCSLDTYCNNECFGLFNDNIKVRNF